MFLTLVFTTNPDVAHLIGEELSYSSSHEGLIFYNDETKEEIYRDESRVKTSVLSAPIQNDNTEFVTTSITEQYTYVFMYTNLTYLKNKDGAEIV